MKYIIIVLSSLITKIVTAQNKLIVIQNGKEYAGESGSYNTPLNRDSIKLLFPTQLNKKGGYVAAQVAILPYPSDTDLAKVGKKIESIPYFAPGTSMATDAVTGYDYFTINPEGHHLIFWDKTNEHFANALTKRKNDTYLEWNLHTYMDNYARVETAINKLTSLETMYMVIVMDYNENDVIDKGELWMFAIQFIDY